MRGMLTFLILVMLATTMLASVQQDTNGFVTSRGCMSEKFTK